MPLSGRLLGCEAQCAHPRMYGRPDTILSRLSNKDSQTLVTIVTRSPPIFCVSVSPSCSLLHRSRASILASCTLQLVLEHRGGRRRCTRSLSQIEVSLGEREEGGKLYNFARRAFLSLFLPFGAISTSVWDPQVFYSHFCHFLQGKNYNNIIHFIPKINHLR